MTKIIFPVQPTPPILIDYSRKKVTLRNTNFYRYRDSIKIGDKFTALTVISFGGRISKGKRAIICICSCGKICEVWPSRLLTGQRKSCGHLNQAGKDFISRVNKYNAFVRHTHYRYKLSARKRNIAWDISIEDFKIIIKQACIYCGTINNTIKYKDNAYIANGLDRVNNINGYIKDNVVPCCGPCNFAKSNKTVEEFLSHIKCIYENLKLNDSKAIINLITKL